MSTAPSRNIGDFLEYKGGVQADDRFLVREYGELSRRVSESAELFRIRTLVVLVKLVAIDKAHNFQTVFSRQGGESRNVN
jgi:hypothetical protein